MFNTVEGFDKVNHQSPHLIPVGPAVSNPVNYILDTSAHIFILQKTFLPPHISCLHQGRRKKFPIHLTGFFAVVVAKIQEATDVNGNQFFPQHLIFYFFKE
jgi:hypothetical protein